MITSTRGGKFKLVSNVVGPRTKLSEFRREVAKLAAKHGLERPAKRKATKSKRRPAARRRRKTGRGR